MTFDLDQSTYLDAVDEPLDIFGHSDVFDCADFLPEDGDDGDGVFADSIDYQEFDNLDNSLTTRPFDATNATTGESQRCDSPPISNSIPSEAQLKAQYSEALQKLAESMQRTEESRRHVIMHRHMLTPEQKLALELAKQQLRQHQIQFVALQQQFRPSSEQPRQSTFSSSQVGADSSTTTRSLSPVRSSIMDAFLSGSRGNLTNGLDQSRAQLGNYMGQMNQRIFWG